MTEPHLGVENAENNQFTRIRSTTDPFHPVRNAAGKRMRERPSLSDADRYSQPPAQTCHRSAVVAPDRTELPRYESLELSVALKAKYTNPYDLRQVSLDGLFTGPDGMQMKVPGFWDGEATWRVRFTPSQVGEWSYSLTVKDARGTSLPYEGKFTVTASDLHGWLQAGNWVNPAYSGHYLVYQDGTPFYGVGHCDALNILWMGSALTRVLVFSMK